MFRHRSTVMRWCIVAVAFTLAFVYLRSEMNQNHPHHSETRDNSNRKLLTNSDTNPPTSSRSDPLSNPDESQVIILAYFRTGSSVLGALLNQVPGAFYVFEPLRPLLIRSRDHRATISFLNTSLPKMAPLEEGYEIPMVKQTFESLYNCDLGNLYSLTPSGIDHTHAFYMYQKCTHYKQNPQPVCLQQFVERCRRQPFKVVKTIRLSMRTVEYFLGSYPKLKVIHLLRDPRAALCSMGCMKRQQWGRRCSKMFHDVTTRKMLEERYPGRFLEVIYEDFAHHPVKMAQKIFHFVEKPFTDDVKQWVVSNTLSGRQVSGLNSLVRANSTEAAYKWINKMTAKTIQVANQHCSSLIKYGNFLKVTSLIDVIQFRIPHRPFN